MPLFIREVEEGHSALSVVLLLLGKISEAIPALEKAIASKPGDLTAQTNLALAYKQAGAHAKAISLMPPACYGQTKCPWLNKATARGILGGQVSVTVDLNPRGDGECKFSRQQGEAVFQLRISVGKMTNVAKQFRTYLALCPPNSPALRTIGNEAMTCTTGGKAGNYGGDCSQPRS